MNVFGGTQERTVAVRRGKRGPAGEPESIKDLCQWLPRVMTKNLREISQDGTYIIEDSTKDVAIENKKDVKKWISRRIDGKQNLQLDEEKLAGKLYPLGNGKYAIRFNKSGYSCNKIPLLSNIHPGYICITFRTLSHDKKVLISNYTDKGEPYFEIQVSRSEILIVAAYHSAKTFYYTIPYDCTTWTTFFMSHHFAHYSPDKMLFRYIINNDPGNAGSFKVKKKKTEQDGFCLGSRWYDPCMYFQGDIACLELYKSLSYMYEHIPECLRDLICKGQMQIVAE